MLDALFAAIGLFLIVGGAESAMKGGAGSFLAGILALAAGAGMLGAAML